MQICQSSRKHLLKLEEEALCQLYSKANQLGLFINLPQL